MLYARSLLELYNKSHTRLSKNVKHLLNDYDFFILLTIKGLKKGVHQFKV